MKKRETTADKTDKPAFVEGVDFYFENGLTVLTAEYLRKRGYCCRSGCRHCPYDDTDKDQSRTSSNSL